MDYKILVQRALLALCASGFIAIAAPDARAEKYIINISCCAKGDPCKPHRISCDVGTLWSDCAKAACGYSLSVPRSRVKLIGKLPAQSQKPAKK